MNNQIVLIVEDEKDISDMIALYLSDIPDIEVIQACSGEVAIDIFNKNDIDLILLDIALPQITGYSVLQTIREKKNIPVIIVSAKSQDNETILGLNLGADDYITKPFNPLVLVARVKAQLRRLPINNDAVNGIIRIGDLELNTATCTLSKDGVQIDLTYTEYNLLRHFMKSPRRVFTKRQLFQAVWDDDTGYYDNTIMVYISKLREKIEGDPKNPQYIKTVRGLGYKFETEK